MRERDVFTGMEEVGDCFILLVDHQSTNYIDGRSCGQVEKSDTIQ